MSFTLSMARLEAMLREDVPYGDLTTQGLGIAEASGRATLAARAAMTVCCAEEAATLFQLAGAREVRRLATSGALLEPGSPILTAEGPAGALQAASKVAQTLVEIASGIATRASRIRAAAQLGRPGVVVAGTRKHLPGAKDLSLRALTAGGCVPHRLGLSDSILVFAQHRAFLGREPPHLWVSRLRAAQPERKIAVEAESVDQAVQMAHAGVDMVQCDKMTPDQLAEVIRALSSHPSRPLIAATGGIHEGNAADYARAGADLLVTSAAYSASPLDVSVVMEKI
ncbi:ModD protein [Roseomonas sp. 18066]|uniref:ModD protein n=1 Tax=Roseomonas sp. 18066 TaxID=2681412 RepID=UPI00135A6FEC|nr:ModD protein [Roseomonas sp. 18066]